MPTLAQWY